MKVESISLANTPISEKRPPAVDIEVERQKAQNVASVRSGEVNMIQQEELFDKIKELTDDGKYSVRFEVDDSVQQLVITLIDADGEMIRQIPSEEFLSVISNLRDLRGNFIDSVS